MKNWKPFNDECGRCGGGFIHILTDSKKDGYAYDGDDAECIECGLKGSVCVNGDEDDNGDATAHISWNDYDED